MQLLSKQLHDLNLNAGCRQIYLLEIIGMAFPCASNCFPVDYITYVFIFFIWPAIVPLVQ